MNRLTFGRCGPLSDERACWKVNIQLALALINVFWGQGMVSPSKYNSSAGEILSSTSLVQMQGIVRFF